MRLLRDTLLVLLAVFIVLWASSRVVTALVFFVVVVAGFYAWDRRQAGPG